MDWTSASIKDNFRFVEVEWSPSLKEIRELMNITGGDMEENYLTALKSSARLSYIDSLYMPKNLIRVWYDAEDTQTGEKESIALGTFFVSTPQSEVSNVTDTGDADCYSVLQAALDNCVTNTYSVLKGESPLYAAIDLLESCGLTVFFTETNKVATSSMSWKSGTSKLEIVNDLMDSIGYNSALVDGMGNVLLRKYSSAYDGDPTVTLTDDNKCIFAPNFRHEKDTFNVANRVICVYSTDDKCYTQIAVNDNPDSEFSTVTRGRYIDRTEEINSISIPEGTPEEEIDKFINSELLTRANNILYNESEVVESYEFDHTFYPYKLNDALRIIYSSAGIDTTMVVVKFGINFDHGAIKTPRIRRFVR